MSLFFLHHTKAHDNYTESETMAQKATLQPCSDQHAQTKGHHHTAPKLIMPAHKKHPLHHSMQGVL